MGVHHVGGEGHDAEDLLPADDGEGHEERRREGRPVERLQDFEREASGATRTFHVSCTKPSKYEADVGMTVHGPDHFSMTQDLVAEHDGKRNAGKMSFVYRRVGDCPK